MNRVRVRAPGGLLFGLLLALAAGCAPSVRPVPQPADLESADEPVQRQYEVARNAVELAGSRGSSAEAYGRLGMWYQAYRLSEGAEISYDNALDLAPGTPKWSYLRGVLRAQDHRLEEAVADLAVAVDAGSVAAATRLAEVETALGRETPALLRLEELSTARVAKPATANVRATVALARTRARHGELDSAIHLFERALELQPSASHLRYEMGVWLERSGRTDRAAVELAQGEPTAEPEPLKMPDPWIREVEELDVSCLGLLRRARRAMASGRHHAALDLFRRSQTADPRRVAPRYGEVRALSALGRRGEALRAAGRLVEQFPQDPQGLVLLGRLFQPAEIERAEASFLRALELHPDSIGALQELARLRRSRGDLDSAEALYRRAFELLPSSESLALELSEIQVELGETEKAKATLRAALLVAEAPRVLRLRLERLGSGS
ncbi:MAG: tetratricopeptide repeat protein [Thermoanaerobaculia bacterium]|nr:tetratricopeptide repeat protein [Thermoanaerobaculia bacterium]